MEILQRAAMRHHVKQSNFNRLEERFSSSKTMLSYFVDELVQNQEVDIACSVVKRHQLLNGESYLKPETQEIITSSLADDGLHKYIENELLQTDDYLPTDELLGIIPINTCLHLSDFGVDVKKDIIWLDDCASSEFEEAQPRYSNLIRSWLGW